MTSRRAAGGLAVLVGTVLTAVPASPASADPVSVFPRSGAIVQAGTTVRLAPAAGSILTGAQLLAPGRSWRLRLRAGAGPNWWQTTLPGGVPPARKVTLRLTSTSGSEPVTSRVFYRVATPLARAADGFRYVARPEPAVGHGRTLTYAVGVQGQLRRLAPGLVVAVSSALGDSARGWTAFGGVRLRRVADPDDADVRIVLARPGMVDRLCARAGISTAGVYSCYNGRYTALNAWRWNNGAPGFHKDLGLYRRYLVNHEVGHALGHGHRSCPRRGALAPVMVQQTKSLQGCRANGFPYPS